VRINLPNQVTITRLIITIVFVLLLGQYDYAHRDREVWLARICLVLFVVAAITDAIDGYLARRQKQVTSFGRILDPFVDKILVCGAFCLFAGAAFYDPLEARYVTSVHPWMVVVVVGRELLVSSLRSFSEGQGTSFAASLYGKTKMVVQSFAVGAVLGGLSGIDELFGRRFYQGLQTLSVWVAVIVTALSMVSYIYQARTFLSQTTAPPDQPPQPSTPGD